MAAGLLDEAGVGWSAVDRIAVGRGPRHVHGAARRRGHRARPRAVAVGASSSACRAPRALALPALASGPDAVLAVIDARRGEAFAAAYEAGDGGAPRELAAPRPLAPQDLAGVIADVEEGGAGRRAWLAVGDGALRFREQLQEAGVAGGARRPRRFTCVSAAADVRAGRRTRRRRACASWCPTTAGARTRS